MDQTLLALIAELPGLEAAKVAIEARITSIQRSAAQLTPARPVPPGVDPAILGFDTRGRVIRRRQQSPELLEKRREAIKIARAAKLDQLVTTAAGEV